jgi:hypothetical protein
VFNVLQNNPNLTYLNLSHNHFSDISGEVLGPAICDNEAIKVLNLSWNKIRTPGGMAIAECLEVMYGVGLLVHGPHQVAAKLLIGKVQN